MKNAVTSLFVFVCVLGCEKSEDQAEEVTYATLQVEAVAESEGGEVTFNRATCTNDPDSGLFTAEFTGPSGRLLSVKVKGWSTTANTYACSQASDNTSGDIGNKFDVCAVELVIPDPETSVNTYAMHRSTEDVKDFEYAGDCTITTTYTEPQVQGTIACNGLVQTDLQGAPRNPIDAPVTAAISDGSSFFCDL